MLPEAIYKSCHQSAAAFIEINQGLARTEDLNTLRSDWNALPARSADLPTQPQLNPQPERGGM